MKFLTGDKALDRRLQEVGTRIANKAVAAGIRAGLTTISKAIRSEIDNPRVRKAIGSRFKRKRTKGITSAKVGGGVGRRGAKPARRGRAGVGITKENVHWYLLGTAQRANQHGHNRGRMPPHPAVKLGFAKSQSSAMAKVSERIRSTIDREVNKLR